MFVTLEGIEGSGKSTLVERLGARLTARAIPVVLTFEPGATRVGAAIRRVLLDARNENLVPLAELFLYGADRAQHVERIIRPALEKGNWVLCDRYFDATTVYQGHGRGLDSHLVGLVNDRACAGVRPDVTFLLDCPVDVGLSRARTRNARSAEPGQDRFERERRAFHQSIRDGYLKLAQDEPERFRVVDATLTEDRLEQAVFDQLVAMQPEALGAES